MRLKQLSKERGFAILIVLAVIATTSVVLATQLASVENQQMMAIRAAQELKARDVAEGCLSAADAYLRDFALADTSTDFDLLLDPDDNLGTTDDNFLPPDDLLDNHLGEVAVPPAATDQFHRYKAFGVTGVGNCLIRFDDNSDDSSTLLALNRFTDAGEGTGVDLPQRDRDRAMSITVIGVVPERAVVADIYPRAMAVASITVLRAMPPAIAQGAAIEAGGDAVLDGEICGNQAGVVADSVTGGVCVCGVLDAQLITGSTGPCGCAPCAPSAGSTTGAGARPDPDVQVPPFAGFMSNESFGLPGSSGNNIGATGVCKLYFRDDDAPTSTMAVGSGDSQVFLWDAFDANARATLVAKFPASASTAATVPVENCTNVTSDPIPKPCNWSLDGAGVPNGVSCAAGQSGCWKLVAHLRDGAGKADFDPTVAGNQAELASTGGGGAGDHFQAKNAIPNMADSTRTWANYCGGCTGCGGPSSTIEGVNAPGAYKVSALTSANFPSPAIIAFETTPGDNATDGALFTGSPDISMDLGTAASAKIGFLTNGGVQVTANSKVCCPTCDCPTIGGINNSAQCSPEGANAVAISATGFAIRAEGNCAFGGKAIAFVGRIDCDTIDSDNGDCYIGDLVSHQPEPGPFDCDLPGTPAAAFCSTSSGICFKNTANIRGNLFAHSNICSKNNLSVSGSIQSEDNVGWKNNGAINGQVRAEEDVGAKNNNDITFNGVGGSSAAQGIPASLWIDGMW